MKVQALAAHIFSACASCEVCGRYSPVLISAHMVAFSCSVDGIVTSVESGCCETAHIGSSGTFRSRRAPGVSAAPPASVASETADCMGENLSCSTRTGPDLRPRASGAVSCGNRSPKESRTTSSTPVAAEELATRLPLPPTCAKLFHMFTSTANR